MTTSRRDALKAALGAGMASLLSLDPAAFGSRPPHSSPGRAGESPLRARALPLDAVRLTGGPLKHAQELDARYLLHLEPDRMLAFYRVRAGLPQKAEPYGGWDGGGRNLTGHIAGHYLSAVSLMWAATGDARFRDRAGYIVRELAAVQQRNGDGYLGALEGGREGFAALARGEIRSAAFDLNGLWSPWYTLHKTFAGLRDAWRHTGDRLALEVETRFAGWAERILAGLTDEQLQHMMNTEFGGMNEVLADLSADSGDPRWLRLSATAFEHRAFIAPLQRHQDDLGGTHANTQIPKILGSAKRYLYAGAPADLMAAAFFWDQVVQHHSFATGGHGRDEYFGPPDRLSEQVLGGGRTCETCNVYNMLKLTRLLFALDPDPHYADYHERALFNQILASIDPEDGRVCYMVPVGGGRGVEHEYQDMDRDFTCDVGTGMESHALHGDGLYYESAAPAEPATLWVNLYAPSTADWARAGARVTLETGFPEGDDAKLVLTLGRPRDLTIALRRPWWVADGFALRVNGEPWAGARGSGGAREPSPERGRGQYGFTAPVSTYVEVRRLWRSGDTVELTLPKSLRLEATPDNPRRASILWGPLVLAGDLGPERARGADRRDAPPPPPAVPVLVAAERPPAEWMRRVPGDAVRYRTDGVGHEPTAAGGPQDVELWPFYRLHRRTYSTYWDLYTPAEWVEQRAEYAREAERQRRLEAATVAWVQPGDTAVERQFHHQAGAGVFPLRMLGRQGRGGASWFSYELPVAGAEPATLIATYYSGDRRGLPAEFTVLVDGQVVAQQSLRLGDPPRFFDVAYSLPAALLKGKRSVTVRFQAVAGSRIASVFGVRLIRGEAP